jgi:hypothetical protein
MTTLVRLETSNVATSSRPFGTVSGVQLVAVFQSSLPGLRSHVALPARPEAGISNSNDVDKSATTDVGRRTRQEAPELSGRVVV